MISNTAKIEDIRHGQPAKKYTNVFYDIEWQNKIKRIASAYYPTAVLKNKLTGNVLIDVQINADGSVFNVVLLQSSGTKIVDNTAIKTVHLAAPFAPLTDEILDETQIYRIIRNWHFENGVLTF